MGCICLPRQSPEQRDEENYSQRMDKVLNETREHDLKVVKLLLLGTGESGKSTIFKQMNIIYDRGFSDHEKTSFRSIIRRNVVECIQTLINGMPKFNAIFSSQESEAKATQLLAIDSLENEFWQDSIVPAIVHLWNRENAIKIVYKNRSRIQLMDSADYLLSNIERIGENDYLPTDEDILRARARTSGIIERTFSINNVDFKFLDVGGQRNERRKWIHCFEDVTAIIYVTAISEYDQGLYEDEKVNRLDESLRVFEQIINNRYFASSTIILFLNKKDLFEDKLKLVRLGDFFPEYTGDNQFEDAAKFIQDKFIHLTNDKNRLIFPHLTCATDTSNVQKVFDACKLTILSNNLVKLGLT